MTAKITVSLGDWDVFGWDEDLEKAIQVDVVGGGKDGEITITINRGPDFDAAVRKIGKEMIEAFFNTGDGIYADMGPDGVRLHSESFEGEPSSILIPWSFETAKEGFAGDRGQGVGLNIRDRATLRSLIALCRDECFLQDYPFPDVPETDC